MTQERQATLQLLGMLGITAATAAVFWIAEGAQDGLQSGAILLAFTLVVHVGRSRTP